MLEDTCRMSHRCCGRRCFGDSKGALACEKRADEYFGRRYESFGVLLCAKNLLLQEHSHLRAVHRSVDRALEISCKIETVWLETRG